MKTEFPLINTVIENNQEGHVFQIGNSSFIIHKSGFSYFEIREDFAAEEALNFLASEDKLPQYFHIYNPAVSLVNRIESDERFGIKYRKRIQLRYEGNRIERKYRDKLTGSYQTQIITDINFDALEVFGLQLGNQFWKSKDDFIRIGYGTIIVNENNEPVSICYSSCVAAGIAEIDVATLSDYQGNGLAKAVTESFVSESISKNIKANWDCFESNIPSLRTAISIGFSKLKEYWFLSVYIKGKDK